MKSISNLIKRKKLVKFCLLFGGSLCSTFKINYYFCQFIYKSYCFGAYKSLIWSIKKLIPFILTTIKTKNNFLFFTEISLYSKIFSDNFYNTFIKKSLVVKKGMFTRLNFNFLNIMANVNNFSVLILLGFDKHQNIIWEGKEYNIPIVSLVSSGNASSLVDYPIFVNKLFFHTIFFFLQLFFKLIFLGLSRRGKLS